MDPMDPFLSFSPGAEFPPRNFSRVPSLWQRSEKELVTLLDSWSPDPPFRKIAPSMMGIVDIMGPMINIDMGRGIYMTSL